MFRHIATTNSWLTLRLIHIPIIAESVLINKILYLGRLVDQLLTCINGVLPNGLQMVQRGQHILSVLRDPDLSLCAVVLGFGPREGGDPVLGAWGAEEEGEEQCYHNEPEIKEYMWCFKKWCVYVRDYKMSSLEGRIELGVVGSPTESNRMH